MHTESAMAHSVRTKRPQLTSSTVRAVQHSSSGIPGSAALVMSWLAVLLLVMVQLHPVAADVITTDLEEFSGFQVLHRFAYQPAGDTPKATEFAEFTAGSAVLNMTVKSEVPLLVGVFSDARSDFDSMVAAATQETCNSFAEGADVLYYVRPSAGWQAISEVFEDGETHFRMVSIGVCNQDKSHNSSIGHVEYQLVMLNPGGVFNRQFSADVNWEFPGTLGFLLLYTPCVAAALYKAVRYQQSVHARGFVLLVVVMVGQLLALVMYAFHFTWWSSAGYGTTAFVIASAIDRAQNVAFLFLLVYIMKGWNTLHSAMRGYTHMTTLILVSVLVSAYIWSFLWNALDLSSNKATVLYLYESVPGIIILVCRLIIMLWYFWVFYHRMSKLDGASDQAAYFAAMGTVGSIYFLMLPSMVVFAAVLPHVLRPKLVFLVNLLINLIAAPPFLYFTHPKRVMRTFHSVKSMKAPAPAVDGSAQGADEARDPNPLLDALDDVEANPQQTWPDAGTPGSPQRSPPKTTPRRGGSSDRGFDGAGAGAGAGSEVAPSAQRRHIVVQSAAAAGSSTPPANTSVVGGVRTGFATEAFGSSGPVRTASGGGASAKPLRSASSWHAGAHGSPAASSSSPLTRGRSWIRGRTQARGSKRWGGNSPASSWSDRSTSAGLKPHEAVFADAIDFDAVGSNESPMQLGSPNS